MGFEREFDLRPVNQQRGIGTLIRFVHDFLFFVFLCALKRIRCCNVKRYAHHVTFDSSGLIAAQPEKLSNTPFSPPVVILLCSYCKPNQFSNLDLVSRDHGSLLGLANTNTHLTDVNGELIAVKSTVTDVHQGKEPVMATIKLDNGVSVSLCLFDSQAVSFLNKLESFCDEPRVTVATSIIRRFRTEPIVSWNTDKFLSFCMTAVLEFHFRNTYFFKWSNLQNAPAATAKVAKTARVA
ncbi:hypothetical protein Bca4012_060706 [Brassica carinata]